MSPCGICGVHLESMGEVKVHDSGDVRNANGYNNNRRMRNEGRGRWHDMVIEIVRVKVVKHS
jgi:hypothetical protein